MAEVDRFASSDDLYSITVNGSMNPAIHHPRWYVATKLLSEGEASAAESPMIPVPQQPSPVALVSTSVFSQFSFGDFRIVCLGNQWSITTIQQPSFARARDLCSSVFELLPHTPVSGYSLSFAFHRATPLRDVGKYLATLAEKLPLGFKPQAGSRPLSATFRYQLARDDGEVVAMVEPSRRTATKVFIAINSSYQITEKGLFDLRPKLENSFQRTIPDVEEWLRNILSNFENLNPEGGMSNANR
jgi:hypothetical protein